MDEKPYLERGSTRDAEVFYNKKIGRKRTYKENGLVTRTPMRIQNSKNQKVYKNISTI